MFENVIKPHIVSETSSLTGPVLPSTPNKTSLVRLHPAPSPVSAISLQEAGGILPPAKAGLLSVGSSPADHPLFSEERAEQLPPGGCCLSRTTGS